MSVDTVVSVGVCVEWGEGVGLEGARMFSVVDNCFLANLPGNSVVLRGRGDEREVGAAVVCGDEVARGGEVVLGAEVVSGAEVVRGAEVVSGAEVVGGGRGVSY